MKKLALSLALSLSVALPAMANSFQVGTVKELAVEHDRATFQLDTTASQIDIRADCLNTSKELTFIIDFNKVGGESLFQTVSKAKESGGTLLVNGNGVCIGDEQETVDRLVPQ